MGKLSGSVAIVTGGASGIGEAICSRFAEEGAKVIVADIHLHRAASVAKEIQQHGKGEAAAYRIDVTDPKQVQTMVDRAVEEHGKIDILVTSAGVFNFASTEEMTPAHWKKILDVDLNGVFYSCLYAGREMIKKKRGKIVNVSSMAGIVGMPNSIGYVAAKHGVVGITRALAIDFGRHGVNVNCLCPGTTLTPLVTDNYTKEYLDIRGKMVPLGRLSSPREQADAALFLASADSDYVNGLIMYVDGGMYSLFSGYSGMQK
jgi:3-oxoacyl-[acyl-carrier protein] reductase